MSNDVYVHQTRRICKVYILDLSSMDNQSGVECFFSLDIDCSAKRAQRGFQLQRTGVHSGLFFLTKKSVADDI